MGEANCDLWDDEKRSELCLVRRTRSTVCVSFYCVGLLCLKNYEHDGASAGERSEANCDLGAARDLPGVKRSESCWVHGFMAGVYGCMEVRKVPCCCGRMGRCDVARRS